ncbi:MAG TPA: nuclear transport factor 2 family protein [Blastocatellia bacterium]|nr:nuclear transport factor 2 family protein [Blastocatellia bacterium]
MKMLIQSLMTLSICFVLSLAANAKTPTAAKVASPSKAEASNDATAIRAVLDAQVAAWNAGKLEEFMTGYWRSPKLTFFSGGRKLESWDATLERYRKNYQSEGKEMGKLQFLDLDIQTFGTGAVVRGRFELTMSDGKKPTGLFTLVFRKFNKDWKIIHDHTSTN